MKIFLPLYFIHIAINKDAEYIAGMCRLIWAFVVRMQQSQAFSPQGLFILMQWHLLNLISSSRR